MGELLVICDCVLMYTCKYLETPLLRYSTGARYKKAGSHENEIPPEPLKGVEPLTCALRVRRSTD